MGTYHCIRNRSNCRSIWNFAHAIPHRDTYRSLARSTYHSLARSTARRRVLPSLHRDLRRTQASTQSRKRNKGFIAELESETIKIWG